MRRFVVIGGSLALQNAGQLILVAVVVPRQRHLSLRDDALTGVSDGIGIEKVQLVELNGLKILHKTSLRIDLLRLSFF